MSVTLSSSRPLSAREWLAIHDPSYRQHVSPRMRRFQKRRHEGRKARHQRHMQELHSVLLRGVK